MTDHVTLHRDGAELPRLDEQQLGHLRHIENLAALPDHDWSKMQGRLPFQEDFGSFRFQLAYAAYTLAVTHYHHLPAAPAAVRATYEKLLHKMLLPDVWMYWRDVSQGGGNFLNHHLRGTFPERWDPVAEDNIMYSAYVQSMALLYAVLFDDDRYAQPGALTMSLRPNTFGEGDLDFVYDQETLNENLYWQMVHSGYLGIACEPNCVFQICNQPAIFGFRMHDARYGGTVADEVTRGWLEAWQQFGGNLDSTGHYNTFLALDSSTLIPNPGPAPWVDAWLGVLLNMWHGQFVHHHYSRQLEDFLVHEPGGTLSIRPAPPRMIPSGTRPSENDTGEFGWTALWAAEMGDTATRDGLLDHADQHFEPTWECGGLYYPRCDTRTDGAGRFRFVEPITGNVLLGWARLNVPNGLRALYQYPWGQARFTEPALVDITGDVDVVRAVVDGNHLVLTLVPRIPAVGTVTARIGRVWGRGPWHLFCDGTVVASGSASDVDPGSREHTRRDDETLTFTSPGDTEHTWILEFEQ